MAKIVLYIQGDDSDIQRKISGVKTSLQDLQQTGARINIAPATKETAKATEQLVKVNGELIDQQRTFTNGELTKTVNTYRQSVGETVKVTQDLNGATAKVTVTERTNSEALKKQADAAELAAKRNSLLGDSLDRIVAKIIAWQVINGAVASVIRSFREALATMKEVDQQLINIQKVSNLTAEELDRIGDSAYKTASKYGVAADEYLSAVYTFQKAGLGDSSEEMAELAVKTMLVGDTTADVASQFLISANAAWKYKGNITELSRVVDEADKLNNNYAVTLQDIAEGLPIVGATAAQVGMTTEQTMAAIATIVASTGQSATKAATALRAIIMNLIGQTGTLDDGLEVTAESIASLNTVLNVYAKDSLAAAEAAGKILDPMEAIAALAQAAEEGFLNEAQLFEVLSGLGGKLRTTQLTALVNNMEMYNSMLKDTSEAAGTADAEVSTMLESWNAKTQILKNTWTEFIAGIVSTTVIKDSLEALIILVDGLDTGVGRLVVQIGAVGTAIRVLLKAFAADPVLAGILTAIGVVGLVAGGVKRANEEKEKYMLDNYGELVRGQSAVEIAQRAKDKGSLRGDALDTLYNQYQATQRERAQMLVEQAKAQKELDYLSEQIQNTNYYKSGFKDKSDYEDYLRYGEEALELGQKLNEHKDKLGDYNEVLDAMVGLLGGYVPAAENATAATEDEEDAAVSLTEQIEAQQAALEALNTEIDNTQSALATITAAQEEYNETGGLSVDTIQSLLSLDKEYLDALIDENGQINLNSDAVSDLIDGKNVLLDKLVAEATATYAVEHAQELLAKQNGEVAEGADTMADNISAAAETTMKLGISSMAAAAGVKSLSAVLAEEGLAAGLQGEFFTQWWNDVMDYYDKASSLVSKTGAGGSGWTPTSTGGKTGGSTSSGKDEELERRKSIISLLKSELSLMQERGDSEEEQIAKMRKIQEALHDEAEYLRSINADEAEINALSKEWWQYQNKIADLYDDIAEKQRQILEDMRDAENDRYQNLIDSLQGAKEIADENLKIEEKKLAVLQAQADLINAQNERTIRYWNAKTGQWEWAANQQDVQAAKDALKDAKQALKDAQAQKRINDIQRAQDAANAQWASIMALPPEVQAEIISAGGSGGLMTSQQAAQIVTGTSYGAVSNPQFTSGPGQNVHNGNVYQMGGITISEGRARSMTVYDLAQYARGLAVQGSTY